MPISAQDDALSVTENVITASNGNVLANDSSPQGGLTVTAVGGSSGNVGLMVYGTYGYVRINTDGSYTYTLSDNTATNSLAAGATGQDSFVYTVRNTAGEQALATLRVTVNGVNDNPVAVADIARPTSPGSHAPGNVLSNDSDIDRGDVLSITNVNGLAPGTISGTYGVLQIGSNGTYSYTQTANILHEGDTASDFFNYTVSDGRGGLANSTLTVAVRGSDPAPAFTAQLGTPLPLNGGNNSGFAVAKLANERTLVISAGSQGGSVYEIKAQVIDALGNSVSSSMLSQGGSGGVVSYVSAAELTAGKVVAVWGTGGLGDSSAFQILDANGTAIGQPVSLTMVNMTPSQMQTQATALAGNKFVMSWREMNYDNVNGQQINTVTTRFQIFDDTGSQLTQKVAIGNPSINGGVAALFANSDGGFTAAWFNGQSWNQPKSILVQSFSSTGQPLGAETTIGFASSNARDMGLVALGNGTLLTYWQDGLDVMGQVYDSRTSLLTDPFRIVGDNIGGEQRLSIAPTADGGFFAVFVATPGINSAADLGKESLRAQVFDGSGNRIGGSFEIRAPKAPGSNANLGSQQVSLEAHPDGTVAAYWTENFYDQTTGRQVYSLHSNTITYDQAPEYLLGSGAANVLIGDESDNTLVGFGGNDILIGGLDADLMDGGQGNDTFFVDNAGDRVIERTGEGIDRVHASLSYALAAGSAVEELFTTDASGVGEINLTGNQFSQLIVGNAGSNILNGGIGGGDTLIGNGGNDILIGGSGALNTLQGGTGNDFYFIGNASDSVIEFIGGGTDQVRTSILRYVLPDEVEQLIFTGIGSFNGVGNSGANLIVGGNGANTLDGGAGDDVLIGGMSSDILIGGLGINTLQGGAGNDFYFVTNTGDSIVELAGEGTDQVRTDATSYTLPADVEQLVYIGTANFTGTGNNLANLLVGGAGNDVLNGDAGDDLLVGGVGNDILIGGSGANTLQGGNGDDVYFVSNSGDSIVELIGEGTDQVRTDAASYALAANVEQLVYIGTGAFRGEGNELANLIVGGSGNDVLLGYGGDDALVGGDGNDLLEGGLGADILNGGLGSDRLTGQAGTDSFLFDSAIGGGNIDTITDFATGVDRIWLDEAIFSGLIKGALSSGAFHTGKAAADADDRIIYDPTTGNLYFDADGSGAGAAVQFAILGQGLNFTNGDFLII